jgi:hypothetical protein
MPRAPRRTRRRLDAEIDAALRVAGSPEGTISQPRSMPGDDPELWSDQELADRIRRHLRRGEASLKSARAFGGMMDEAIERERAHGVAGTREELWEQILARHRA